MWFLHVMYLYEAWFLSLIYGGCMFAGKALVGMADVEAAIQEMFQAPHIQVSNDEFLVKFVSLCLSNKTIMNPTMSYS